MAKSKRFSKTNAVLIILAVAFLSVFATTFYYMSKDVVSVAEYDYFFKIDKEGTVGFDVTTELLHFGHLGAGEISTRYVTLANSYNMPLKASIIAYGDYSEMVLPSDNHFVIQPGESREINMTLSTVLGMPFGDYEGKVRVIFKKV